MGRARRGWIVGVTAAAAGAIAAGVVACNAITGLSADFTEVDCFDGGCPDAGAGETGPDADVCAAYAASVCQFTAQCEPGTLKLDYGSLSYCQMVETHRCQNSLDLPHSVVTPSWLAACGGEFATVAAGCDAGPGPLPIPKANDACGTSTALGAGAPCAADGQCASTVCLHAGGVCGTCLSPGGMGAKCAPGDGVVCARGLGCSLASSTCVPYVALGAPCDKGATTLCPVGSDCVSGDGGPDAGTCQPSLTTVGAPCTIGGNGAPDCSGVAGLYCDVTKHCKAYVYETSGPCGPLEGGIVACEVGACIGGTCAPPTPNGMPCIVNQPPGCGLGSLCLYGDASNATCQPFDPSACSAAH